MVGAYHTSAFESLIFSVGKISKLNRLFPDFALQILNYSVSSLSTSEALPSIQPIQVSVLSAQAFLPSFYVSLEALQTVGNCPHVSESTAPGPLLSAAALWLH